MNFEFLKKIRFFSAKNFKKLIILEVPRPREYDRTIPRIEMLLPSSGVVKFHGLGPDLRRVLGQKMMVLLS